MPDRVRNRVLNSDAGSTFSSCSANEQLHKPQSTADIFGMKAMLVMKNNVRCTYLKACYLAEAQECFGFKTDCPLYMQSNGEPCNEARFHAAMDRLIVRTKTKHDFQSNDPVNAPQNDKALPKNPVSS